MSTWTHINGCIRYDSIRFKEEDELHPKLFLGNTCDFEDEEEKWDKCDVPCGSEGSMEYKIIENPDHSCCAAYAVIFYGDLRSYEDLDEIEKYFRKIADGKMIRGATIHAYVEGGDSITLVWDNEKEKLVEYIKK